MPLSWIKSSLAAHQFVSIEQVETSRAQQLEVLGFYFFDALHLACAESGGADVLLTTDDRLFRLASRLSAQLRVHVENPLTWLKEIIKI